MWTLFCPLNILDNGIHHHLHSADDTAVQWPTCDAYDGNNRNIYLTKITYYYYLCSVAIFPTEPRLADSLSPPPVWEQNTSVI